MIYKPESCMKCKVARIGKKKIICGVWDKYTADLDDAETLDLMYNNCVLEWDEKEF